MASHLDAYKTQNQTINYRPKLTAYEKSIFFMFFNAAISPQPMGFFIRRHNSASEKRAESEFLVFTATQNDNRKQ